MKKNLLISILIIIGLPIVIYLCIILFGSILESKLVEMNIFAWNIGARGVYMLFSLILILASLWAFFSKESEKVENENIEVKVQINKYSQKLRDLCLHNSIPTIWQMNFLTRLSELDTSSFSEKHFTLFHEIDNAPKEAKTFNKYKNIP